MKTITLGVVTATATPTACSGGPSDGEFVQAWASVSVRLRLGYWAAASRPPEVTASSLRG